MNRLYFGFVLLLMNVIGLAQTQVAPCLTDELTARLALQDPAFAHTLQQNHQWVLNDIAQGNNSGQRTVYTIPIVFHVVYNNASQNVSEASIVAQVEQLNKDFRRLNSDTTTPRSLFANLGADVEIEFCLAKRDPNNNSVKGITRTYTNVTSWNSNSQPNAMKTAANGGADPWDQDKYMNVWIVNLQSGGGTGGGSTAGYTYLGTNGVHGSPIDGIVLDFSIGFGGTSRTLTHEVGHFLGLPHTWGYGNSCGSDDGISDTPNSDGPKFGCNLNSVSCGSTDMIENYMDYASCANMFTQEQAQYMRSVLVNYRGSYLNSNGCTVWPNPGFYTKFTNVCTGSLVQFVDTTFNDPASWQWTFAGGTPATSSQQNPIVLYDTPGTYSVTLRAFNANGFDEEITTNYITVGVGGVTPVFEEDFESGQTGWTVDNADNGVGWVYSNATGNGGNNAMGINLFNYTTIGERDALNSPIIDMNGISSATMELDYAYRPYSSSDTDSLIIYISTDGGATYPHRVFADGGSSLATGSLENGNFTPTFGEDWCETSCLNIDLTAYAGMSNVRIRFESYNGYGNNIYIDNISVYGACTAPVSTTLAPQAAFSQSDTFGCGNTTIDFVDESLYGSTSWQWLFPGGSPPQSSAQNPSISYNQPGTYNVSLTVLNANGTNTVTKQAVVTIAGDMTATTTDLNPSCVGSNSGTVAVSVDGGTPGYTFNWATGTGTDTILTGLAGGLNDVTITDQAGCETVVQVNVDENPKLNLLMGASPNTGGPDETPTGTASVSVGSGTGVAPYTYSWSNGSTAATAEQLEAGTYTVTVTDATGCTASESVTVVFFRVANGVTDTELSTGVNVYPNPATNTVNLSFTEPVNNIAVTIYSYVGAQVWSKKFTGAHQLLELPLNNIAPGMYFIEISAANGATQQKLMIK